MKMYAIKVIPVVVLMSGVKEVNKHTILNKVKITRLDKTIEMSYTYII